ncbi:hypothetical protein ACQW7T_006092 [Pseudomonas aeruginosa]|uniref:hypothetical protein n=1 Tax=Ectopseudomonas hydrolytica TaxID=2493633 RepID=UPI00277C180E|nr:hypothetical protein [Pseudomonas aeruginosa]EKW6759659.1 hypothetical protein [Pseudomonas aeruginosa]EKY2868282.1 hypothetical protein [Pseudomonas aeruginosa]ELI2562627.1 hypothetical protein [Pseudomonas aeruginosa]
MGMEDMGQVVAYLLRHRIVETRPASGRSNDEERAVAKLLLSMTPDERRSLDRMFLGMRLVFVDFDWDAIPALPKGGRVFLLARDIGKGEPSSVLSPEVVIETMREKGNESAREAAAWFVHLWLIHLDLIYTNQGRSPSELQTYPKGMFDFDVFLARVREHFEDLRQGLDRNEVPADAVFKTFEKASHAEGERRCRRFVNLMLDAGLLTTIAKDVYQQTLLSAYETKRNYERGLQHFVTDAGAKKYLLATSILTGTDNTIDIDMEEQAACR